MHDLDWVTNPVGPVSCDEDGWISVPKDPQSIPSAAVMGTQRQASYSSRQFISDMDRAVQLSMRDHVGKDLFTMEAANPHERTRDGDMPVGIKNVGNSCYFTSIAQNYFAIDEFRNTILKLEFPAELKPGDIRCVAKELQILFAKLILSKRKYVDPTPFLNTLVDKDGNCIHTGAQEDPSEFRLLFLEKIEESIAATIKHQNDVQNDIQNDVQNDVQNESETDEEEADEDNVSDIEKGISNCILDDNNDDDDDELFDMELGIDNKQETKSEQPENELLENTDITNNNTINDENSNNNNNDNSKEDNEIENEYTKMVHKLFVGSFMQTIDVKEIDDTIVQSKQECDFTEIILELSHSNNIYQSLDHYFSQTTIDDYETPKKHKTEAIKYLSIKSLPPVLSFQLQRVGYDPERNASVKNHSEFDFPSEIFMDRYLTTNLEVTKKKREEYNKLLSQKHHYQQLLNGINNYDDSKLSVQHILSTTIEFFQSKDDETLEDTILTLTTSLATVIKRTKEYKNQIDAIDAKISSLYTEMDTLGYRLHSTLVHSGNEAGGGHYWAFLYDNNNQIWYKFNDTNVTIVDEDTVFNESRGGKGNESAYFFTYLHPDTNSGPPPLAENLDNIPLELKSEIEIDNIDHEEEIKNWDERPSISHEFDNSPPSYNHHQMVSYNHHQNQGFMEPDYNMHHYLSDRDDMITREYTPHHITRDHISLFEQKYLQVLNDVETDITLIHGIDLRSFAHFACSIGEFDIMRSEIAQVVLKELFNLHMNSEIARKIPLYNVVVSKCGTSEFYSLKNNYNHCVNCWEFFIQGLRHIENQNFYIGINCFHFCNIRFGKVSTNCPGAKETFMDFLEKCIFICTEDNKAQISSKTSRERIIIICKICSMYPTICEKLRNYWISDDTNRDLLNHFPDLQMQVISVLTVESDYSVHPPSVTLDINEETWKVFSYKLRDITEKLFARYSIYNLE